MCNSYWSDYRGSDGRLRGHCDAIGKKSIDDLAVVQSIPLGGNLQEVYPTTDGSGDLLLAYGGAIQRVRSNGEYCWKSKPCGIHWITGMYDLDLDGRFEIVTSNGIEVLILSAEDGTMLWRENVEYPKGFGTYGSVLHVHRLLHNRRGLQIVAPIYSSKEVLIFDCSNGAEHTYLHKALWMNDSFHPTVTIGDVNNDGVEEVVVAKLGGVYVFDPESGEKLHETLWHSDTERRRNYGQFELCDIDGDGDLEAIILSDRVSRHVAVLDNDGTGRFTPLWDRFIQHIYPSDTTELHYIERSIADHDGDGNIEIALSLFNANESSKWQTEIIDAKTGTTKTVLHDRFLWDAIPQPHGTLLCMSQESTRVPLGKSLEIQCLAPASLERLWHTEGKQFLAKNNRSLITRARFKPDLFDNNGIWSDDKSIFLRSSEGISALDLNNFSEQLRWPIANATIAAQEEDRTIVSTYDGKVFACSESSSQQIISAGYHLTTEAHAASRPGNTATVVRSKEDTLVAVPTFAKEVIVFEVHGQRLSERWRIPARSRLGHDNTFHTVTALHIKGELYFVIVDDDGLDHSRVSLYNEHGNATYRFVFPDLPPSQYGNRIGAYDWQYFEHPQGPALMISFFRSASMNAECTRTVLIETGEVLWQKESTGSGEYGRGFGAWGASAQDNDTARAYFCAKDTLCELDLTTGSLLRIPQLLTSYTTRAMQEAGTYEEQSIDTWSSIKDPFTAYGSPVIVQNEGKKYLFIAGSYGGFGLLNLEGEYCWWRIASFGKAQYHLPAIADIDGDGHLELAQGRADGSITLYDLQTGKKNHELQIDSIATTVGSADLDGDNRSEIIFGTNDGRCIIAGVKHGSFQIERSFHLGGAAGSPMLSCILHPEEPSILITTGDGNLVLIG